MVRFEPNRPKLSVAHQYYIRKLLVKYRGLLKSVVAEGAAVLAHPQADFNQVVDSLYLDTDDIVRAIVKLEQLIAQHQLLASQQLNQRQLVAHQLSYLRKVELEMFWILGLKLIED